MLVLLLLGAFTSQKALAETRVALVIGNSAYAGLAKLSNPANDADLVAASLRKVGFMVTMGRNLDQAGFKRALQGFSATSRGADVALVYFAGHGLEIDGVNYLVPTDATLATDSDVKFEAVPLDYAMTAVEGARRLRLVILDACRNNPVANQMHHTSGTRSVARGLARIEPTADTLVVYAAKAGTTAEDGAGTNSPFAAAFARDVVIPGLEINKLFRQVRDDVLAATGRRQEPFSYGSLSATDFYFSGGPGAASTSSTGATTIVNAVDPKAVELAFWNSVSASNDVAQLSAYLERYPEGSFAPIAQAKIASLGKPPTSTSRSAGQAVDLGARDLNGAISGVGIEGRDIVRMTDRMVRDMLSSPQLAGRATPPRVIIDDQYFRNESSQRINKTIITDRLRVGLNRASQGRMLFVGREFAEMVAQERALKRDGVADAGTTGLTRAQAGADFRLTGRISSLDSAQASTGVVQRYNQIVFEMIDLESGITVWSNVYEFERAAADDVAYQ